MKNTASFKPACLTQLALFAAVLCGIQMAHARVSDHVASSDAGRTQGTTVHTFHDLGLRLPVPTGFMVADTFDGFGQPSSRSAIVLLRFPGAPMSKVSRDITRKAFAGRDMKLISRKTLEISGKSAILFGVHQNVGELPFAKWILVIGDDSETRTLTASYPLSNKTAAARLSASLKQSLLATQWDTIERKRTTEVPAYAVASSKLLKTAARPGRTLIMTSDGKLPTADANSPLLIFAHSLPGNRVSNVETFASQRLSNFKGTRIKQVRTRHYSMTDGIQTSELIADAADVATGNPLRVFQYLRILDDEYVIVQGRVGTETHERYIEEFRKLAHSVVLD